MSDKPSIFTTVRQEWFFALSLPSCVFLLMQGDAFWSRHPSGLWMGVLLFWLFATVIGASMAVVRHAEHLAELLGEPFGTLILTLSVTVIEVTSISSVMLHGDANPTLARDTLFAVIMIILNGMVGLSLLIGGWRHGEQSHNLHGANVYLGVALPLIVLGLVLPDFTRTAPGRTLSFTQRIFLILVSVGLYAIFLRIQTGRHKDYFAAGKLDSHRAADKASWRQVRAPLALLFLHLAPALYLAHQLSRPVDHLIETLHAPAAIGGVILAIIVATPEATGAVRAAMANQLQRSVNIFLGSILSTIGLTIPAMVLIAELVGQQLILGVQHTDLVLLLLSLVVSMLTFSSGRTNVVQGAVHLILFGTYILLIFER